MVTIKIMTMVMVSLKGELLLLLLGALLHSLQLFSLVRNTHLNALMQVSLNEYNAMIHFFGKFFHLVGMQIQLLVF
jgi:hypothetical protein